MQRDTTQEEVCKKFGVSSSMLHRWRKEFQANAANVSRINAIPNRKPTLRDMSREKHLTT
jgi:transposase-like protein